jgi:hypothetical protein
MAGPSPPNVHTIPTTSSLWGCYYEARAAGAVCKSWNATISRLLLPERYWKELVYTGNSRNQRVISRLVLLEGMTTLAVRAGGRFARKVYTQDEEARKRVTSHGRVGCFFSRTD